MNNDRDEKKDEKKDESRASRGFGAMLLGALLEDRLGDLLDLALEPPPRSRFDVVQNLLIGSTAQNLQINGLTNHPTIGVILLEFAASFMVSTKAVITKESKEKAIQLFTLFLDGKSTRKDEEAARLTAELSGQRVGKCPCGFVVDHYDILDPEEKTEAAPSAEKTEQQDAPAAG